LDSAVLPADAKLTKELIRLLAGRDMMGSMSLEPSEVAGFLDTLKMLLAVLPLMGTFRKYGKLTIQEFAQRFQDPFLRDAVRFIIDSPGWPMLQFPMVGLSGLVKSAVLEAGVPLGGSQRDRGGGCTDARIICPLHRKLARIAGRLVHDTGKYDETDSAEELAGSVQLQHGRAVDLAVLRHRDGGAFRTAAHPVAVRKERRALCDLRAMSSTAYWHTPGRLTTSPATRSRTLLMI
jgi:hypothetical protein